jgi:hypothetical protein
MNVNSLNVNANGNGHSVGIFGLNANANLNGKFQNDPFTAPIQSKKLKIYHLFSFILYTILLIKCVYFNYFFPNKTILILYRFMIKITFVQMFLV